MDELDPDGVHPDSGGTPLVSTKTNVSTIATTTITTVTTSAPTTTTTSNAISNITRNIDGGHQQRANAPANEQGSWLCCMPCHWLRTNRGVHQASLSIATLLVTSILVASPVLFLISSLPGSGVITSPGSRNPCSQHGHHKGDERCHDVMDGSITMGIDGGYICQTTPCREAASRMMAAMAPPPDDPHDDNSHPCLDFYRYACAGWSRNSATAPPEQAINFNTLQSQVELDIQGLLTTAEKSPLYRKLGKFYKSCIAMQTKTRSVSPMLSMVSELGGYLPPSNESDPDLTALLVNLLLLDGPLLFDVYLDRDLADPSRLAVFLDLPRRHAHSKPFSLLPESEVHWKNRFRRHSAKESPAYTYMMDSAQEQRLLNLERLLLQFMPTNMSSDIRSKEVQTTLLFASTLNKIYPRMKDIVSMPSRQDSFLLYNISRLQSTFGFANWQRLLEEVLSTNFTDSDKVFVVSPDYFFSVVKMLSHFSPRVTHNALLALYARNSLEELVTGPAAAPTTGTEGTGDLWGRYCTRLTTELFARPVGALYVQHFPPSFIANLQHQIEEMFESIRQTMARRIMVLAWLDDSTRNAALEKLQAMEGRFLTWPQLWNRSYVATLLEKVEIDSDDFFGNVIQRYREKRKVSMDFRDQTTLNNKWAFPFVVNAFYELNLNTLAVPLAVLTQPHFRPDVPEYLRYASVGLIVAHEMLHAFDLSGAGYDARGRPHDWFTPDTRFRLEARLDCIARQYSSTFGKQVRFLGQIVDVQFDWNFTRNENMADISGLQVAYEAWRAKSRGSSYTSDGITGGRNQPKLPGLNLTASQLFFLVAAQTYCSNIAPEEYILLVELDFHTPHPERVNGVMLNSPAFAEAFKCPPGSPMNPTKKCSFW